MSQPYVDLLNIKYLYFPSQYLKINDKKFISNQFDAAFLIPFLGKDKSAFIFGSYYRSIETYNNSGWLKIYSMEYRLDMITGRSMINLKHWLLRYRKLILMKLILMKIIFKYAAPYFRNIRQRKMCSIILAYVLFSEIGCSIKKNIIFIRPMIRPEESFVAPADKKKDGLFAVLGVAWL
jgi:hypothetical protein